MAKSYFPALIQYQDNMEYQVATHPTKIDSGRSFKVLATNVKIR